MNRASRIIVAAACAALVWAGESLPGRNSALDQAVPPPQASSRAAADGLAMTPPMGWYPWNTFGEEPQNEKLIGEIVAALVASGLKEAGYSLVGPDEGICFSRGADGLLVPNLERYPSGLRGLGDVIHRLGLKYALYTDAGTRTCSKAMPGTKGREFEDMRRFAEWRADYLKIDWCNTEGQDIVKTYATLDEAQRAAGRPMIHSLCSWGEGYPWRWAGAVGHLWRTTGDICAPGQADWARAVRVAMANEKLSSFAGPGRWNDPDMMIVGMPGLTEAQSRSLFSLWCLMAAPLIAGNDLRSMSKATIETLTNPEAIGIDQDPLGVQGKVVWSDGNLSLWAGKPLFDGSQAVLVFNQGRHPATKRVVWPEIGLDEKSAHYVRNLWTRETTGPLTGGVTVRVAPDDVALLRVAAKNAFPLPPVVVADSYLVSFRAAGGVPETLAGTITVADKGSAELPLWKIGKGLPAWLSVSVARSGKSQVFTNAVSTAGLKKGSYNAVVRADNTEPISGRPMSALYYDVDLEVARDVDSRRTSEKPMKVVFADKIAEHRWSLQDLDPRLPSDWSAFEFLVMEMRASSPQRFSLWLHTADGKRRLMLQPFGQNVWLRASIPLRYFKGKDQRGMDLASTNNRRTNAYWMQVWGPFGSLDRVEGLSMMMEYPLNKPELEIGSVWLSKTDAGSEFLEKQPVVDDFGQWAHADWPRKVKSRDELEMDLAAEEETLKGGGDFNSGKFGGYLDAKVEATGFFRVAEIDGRWWFVDPEGHPFLSTGANGMRGEGGRVGPEGRPVPGKAGLVYRRMGAWGLNTIGNWSSLKPAEDGSRKAYVTTFRGPRSEPLYLGMPDVYAEAFARAVDQAAEKQCGPNRDDPWLLGYFLGNEPPWPRRESELVDMFLNGPETATRRRLEEYLARGDTPKRREEFVIGMFERYLTLMSQAIKKYDPHHLNLGIRFGGMPAEAIMRLGKAFDVYSLNVYEYEPAAQLKRVYEVTGRPVLIGEFHLGVPADGLGAGLVQTASQAERAKGYRYYLEQAAALPCFVGAHWFQWTDQPVLGRMDGENYNIGFVDVTNRPYAELVEAAKTTHRRLADVHAGKTPPFAERPRASEHGAPDSPWR